MPARDVVVFVSFVVAAVATAQSTKTVPPHHPSVDPLPWILGTVLGVLLTICIGLCVIWIRESRERSHDSPLKTITILPSFSSSASPFSVAAPLTDGHPNASTWQRGIYKLRSSAQNTRDSNILSSTTFNSQLFMSERSVAIMEDKELDDNDFATAGRGGTLLLAWKSTDLQRYPPNLTDSRRQLQNLVRQSMVSETSSFDLSSRGCEFVDPDHRAQYLHDAAHKPSPYLG
ncbi:hypothetical protein DYB28_009592 [Aphanomyces astaci]|uniref:Uncharacterized protein n=2 Tax=Aphanomyces astaci TaxID=112090 RepID=A0A397BA87_APHAT|nr:hypothetical protein DYB36_012402 [Aphanomyces astaci]RHY21014.1 hypothetical protein DYB25_013384 [Aphanomyces astaci]RHY65994.1 hypothetical protein DYB38_007253 [Aphanomyces astaci]RHY76367.1 hypothetical protein DYB30_013561 [Aphanomyces astaci]RHY77217.1 hypothetical protein DYB34_012733 [Aphanomyces astaci]